MLNEKFVTDEELSSIYKDNNELINRIKDGLFSSDFVPHDGMTEHGYNSTLNKSLVLRYDYNNGQLLCYDDPQGEKLQSIQNVQIDIIGYFLLVKDKEKLGPCIRYWKIREGCTIIQFEFVHSKTDTHAGVMYIANPEDFGFIRIHIEGNWYVYRNLMP